MSKDKQLEDLDKAKILQICMGRRLLVDKIKVWLRSEMSDNKFGSYDKECATRLYEKILEWEEKI